MAGENDKNAAEASTKSKSMLPMLAIVGIAVAASVGATMFFLGGEPEVVVVAEEPSQQKALYHNLRPPFIVNYLDGNKPRYLQVDITLMSRDPAVVDDVISHAPLIRSQLVNLLGDQSFGDLQTHDGKLLLRELIGEEVNTVLNNNGSGDIEKVLITNFVMQ